MIMSLLGGCGQSSTNEKTKKKEQTEQSFEKVLAMYPTKNLEAFYDMEGYRDDEFAKGDKGVWSLISNIATSKTKEAPLLSEGMVLRLNRNTRTAKGYYFQRKIQIPEKTEKKYPVTYDRTGFHLVKEVSDSSLRKKIENFQFFVQYGEFKHLSKYKSIHKMYNPEVPMYEFDYQLTNDDPNVKQLRKRYNIPIDKAPFLVLSGRGDLENTSISSKELTFQFSKKPAVYFTDSIDYQPANAEDNQ